MDNQQYMLDLILQADINEVHKNTIARGLYNNDQKQISLNIGKINKTNEYYKKRIGSERLKTFIIKK